MTLDSIRERRKYLFLIGTVVGVFLAGSLGYVFAYDNAQPTVIGENLLNVQNLGTSTNPLSDLFTNEASIANLGDNINAQGHSLENVGSINTEQLFSNSIPASYVVWEDDSGNIYADAQDSNLTSYEGTDFSTVLQNVIDSLTNGGKIYIKKGDYLVESTIFIGSDIVIEGAGQDSVTFTTTTNCLFSNKDWDTASSYNAVSNVKLEGFTIDAEGGVVTCISFSHSESIYIDSVSVKNVDNRHGIEINSTRFVNIKHCYFDNLFLTGARTRSEWIQIEPSGGVFILGSNNDDGTTSSDIFISGCKFNNTDVGIGFHADISPRSHDIFIYANTFTNLARAGVRLMGLEDVVVTNNTFRDSNNYGIEPTNDSGEVRVGGNFFDNIAGREIMGNVTLMSVYPLLKEVKSLKSGLVGFWGMEQNGNASSATTVYDSSPNNLDGTINGAVWTTNVRGVGLDFDGTDDYVNVPDNSAFKSAHVSVSAWVKFDNLPTAVGDYMDIATKGATGKYALYGYITDDSFAFAINTASDGTAVRSDTIISTGVWYYVVGTYDGSDVKIYVNGNCEGSDPSLSGDIATTTHAFQMGGDGTTRNLDGQISRLRVYNRALSAEEVKKLYLGLGPEPTGHLALK